MTEAYLKKEVDVEWAFSEYEYRTVACESVEIDTNDRALLVVPCVRYDQMPLLSRWCESLSALGAAAFGASSSSFSFISWYSKMPPHPQRPANFSWVIADVLAGSAFPYTSGHFAFLKEQGIRHVVTLTEWAAPKQIAPPTMKFHHIAIEEFSAPSIEQIEEVVQLVDTARQNNEGILVHCYWGRGRTGTMLAAYLVKTEGRSPMDAVNHMRRQRPYSVETYEQEGAVIEYAQHLLNKQTTSLSNDEPQ